MKTPKSTKVVVETLKTVTARRRAARFSLEEHHMSKAHSTKDMVKVLKANRDKNA